MKGSFRRRGCTCKKKRCTCGSKWTYRYSIIDPATGKRKQKETSGFATKAEAEQEALRIQSELQSGVYIEEKSITFSDFIPEFLRLYRQTGKVKKSTIWVRRIRLNNLKKYFGNIKIKDISRKNYQDMLLDLKKEGYADETIVSIHSTGKLIFKKAKELEVIKKDPTEYARLPSKQKTVEQLENHSNIPKYLEKEELARFLHTAKNYARDDMEYPIFITLAYTGLRVGELCALKWSDVDFYEGKISITKTINNANNNANNYMLESPKNGRARLVTVSKTVLDILERYQRWQDRNKEKPGYLNRDFVFARYQGKYRGYPIFQRSIAIRMRRLLKASGLNESLTPHSLRHTHTSLLAEAGVSLEVIMDRLGHKNDNTTKNIYLHVTKPKKLEAVDKFDELMNDVGKMWAEEINTD